MFKLKFAAIALIASASLVSAAPRLSLNTTTVGPINVNGTNGPTQTVQALNFGDGSLSLTATASASWLAATVGAKGSCAGANGNCYSISIALNTASLAQGVYTEFITLSDPNAVDAPQDITVTVNTAAVPSTIAAFVTPSGNGNSSSSVTNLFTTGSGIKGAVSTQSGGNWLYFLPGSNGIVPGISPWIIQVNALNGMAPGTYNGTVTLSGSTVAAENKTIAVSMTVSSSPIIQLDNPVTVRIVGAAGGQKQTAYSVLNNTGQGTISVSAVNSSAKFLTGSALSSNLLALVADPTGMAPGLYPATVTLASNAANNAQVKINVEFIVVPAGTPAISQGGLVNAATFASEAVSPGDIIALFGTQLGTTAQAAAVPLPVSLGNAQVLVNDVPAPLFYVSPGQINFQLPYSLTPGVPAIVKVTTGGVSSAARSVNIVATAPRVLPYLSYGIVVNNGDGSLVMPTGTLPGSHPAKPGDNIVFYCVGFGQTNPAATEGAGAGYPQTVQKATVQFGINPFQADPIVTPAFAGLTPTAVGLYQVNVTVPANTSLGAAVPIIVTINGVNANLFNIALSANGN